VEVLPPPYPEYRDQQYGEPCRDYRVEFWEHQLPSEGSDTPPERVGWMELTVDLVAVQDVQEAIEWAEAHIDEALDEALDSLRPRGAAHGERVYCLYVKRPDEDEYLHVAGWNPTIADAECNLPRRRPVAAKD
jgi:hypothetical protein